MSPQELADFLINKVMSLCRESQLDQALEVVEQAINHAPDPTHALLIKARILTGLHLYDDALETTDEALDLREDIEALKLKGNILAIKEDLEGALEIFTKITEMAPKDAESYFLKGGRCQEPAAFVGPLPPGL